MRKREVAHQKRRNYHETQHESTQAQVQKIATTLILLFKNLLTKKCLPGIYS
ncbi:uncharacterized protein METZ01_LOCUS206060 [marine metagenome]|uniref:Uncharacterized protein n=1 Tax=marine metagenome TaxID=408172 RepID=A0A382EQZ3_9ZZZZ